MLGRTDSRRRLLFMLAVFGFVSLALVARTAYWQVWRGDELMAKAAAQTTIRIDEPSRRGDIYDRTGTVLLATTVDRDRLVAAADQMTPQQQAQATEALAKLLRLDQSGHRRAARQAGHRQALRHPRPRHHPQRGGPHPPAQE